MKNCVSPESESRRKALQVEWMSNVDVCSMVDVWLRQYSGQVEADVETNNSRDKIHQIRVPLFAHPCKCTMKTKARCSVRRGSDRNSLRHRQKYVLLIGLACIFRLNSSVCATFRRTIQSNSITLYLSTLEASIYGFQIS